MFTNYYGQTKEQYDACRELIDVSNQRVVFLVTFLSILINGILLIISSFYEGIKEFRVSYLVILAIVSMFGVLLHLSTHLKNNVTIQVYLLIGIELIYAGSLSLVDLTQKGTAFPVFLVLIPILFIDKQIRMSLFLLISCIIYSAVVLKYKVPAEAHDDVFESVTFGGVAMLGHYFLNVKMMRGLVNEKNMQHAIAAYKKVQQKLRQKAETDHLTGLYNRETFVNFARKQIRDKAEENGVIIVGILDVDHFKEINDSFGHQTGDDIIRQVSAVLQKTLRKNDLIGRLGGDEYIFFLNDIEDKEVVTSIAKRILCGLNKVQFAEGIGVGASIGITMTNKKQYHFEDLYYRADIALYKAKELGRNQYCFYEDYMCAVESQISE